MCIEVQSSIFNYRWRLWIESKQHGFAVISQQNVVKLWWSVHVPQMHPQTRWRFSHRSWAIAMQNHMRCWLRIQNTAESLLRWMFCDILHRHRRDEISRWWYMEELRQLHSEWMHRGWKWIDRHIISEELPKAEKLSRREYWIKRLLSNLQQ